MDGCIAGLWFLPTGNVATSTMPETVRATALKTPLTVPMVTPLNALLQRVVQTTLLGISLHPNTALCAPRLSFERAARALSALT